MISTFRERKKTRTSLEIRDFLVDFIYLCFSNLTTPVAAAGLREILSSVSDSSRSPQPRARRPWTRLSDEARGEVAARYGVGETTPALAEAFGVAKSTIIGILREYNVVVRRQPLTAEQVGEAARLYESGLSLSQVAKQMSVNQETMRVAIITLGVIVRRPAGL